MGNLSSPSRYTALICNSGCVWEDSDVTDLLLLALTGALTWGLWRALGEWGAMGMAWLWAGGMWIATLMRG